MRSSLSERNFFYNTYQLKDHLEQTDNIALPPIFYTKLVLKIDMKLLGYFNSFQYREIYKVITVL